MTLKKIDICSSLSNTMSQLPAPPFIRTHRSYAVNINKIEGFDKKDLLLSENYAIPIGHQYKETILQYLNTL